MGLSAEQTAPTLFGVPLKLVSLFTVSTRPNSNLRHPHLGLSSY